MNKKILKIIVFGCVWLITPLTQAQPTQHVNLNRIGNLPLGNAEIVSYENNMAYVTNANDNTIDVINLINPSSPLLTMQIPLSTFGGGINSVTVQNGVIAAAVEANVKQNPGQVVFFDAATGNLLNQITVGALPDMLTFTPDGSFIVCANEGEPNDNYDVDPEGTVSIIDIRNGVINATVTNVDFNAFNVGSARHGELPADVRIFGPGASVAQDLEPEYVAISDDSKKAYVGLQENNAIAVIDIMTANIDRIDALGFKNYNLPGNGIDASDKDGIINIQNWPVLSMYQPDSIAAYGVNGTTYIVTANEGDARDYNGFSEEDRVKDLTLNNAVFPNAATLQQDENLGRLKITTTLGNTDANANDAEQIIGYGARSFSIWNGATGQLVFDSADDFAQIIAAQTPTLFNQNGPGEFDKRSDDKGSEPEALDLAFVGGRVYALIGLERVGGIIIYDITNPVLPEFLIYIPADTVAGTTDNGPEGIKFIDKTNSPNNRPLVLVANEESNNLAIYQLDICTVSALNFTGNQLNIFGNCLEGGVDIYQRINGILTLIQANIILVDAQTIVAIPNLVSGAEYFVAIAGQTDPINNIIAFPQIINQSPQPIPTMSEWSLLLMILSLSMMAFIVRFR